MVKLTHREVNLGIKAISSELKIDRCAPRLIVFIKSLKEDQQASKNPDSILSKV